MDEHGYPTQSELDKIKSWSWEDFTGLMDYIKYLWKYPQYWEQNDNEYSISTGGWSGNEDIIQAMKENIMFWSCCWYQSTRSGHHIFKLIGGKNGNS